MGLHANAGATAINTLGYTTCTTVWGVVLVVIMWCARLRSARARDCCFGPDTVFVHAGPARSCAT